MKLQTKLFIITDSQGKETNVKKRDIGLLLNGEKISYKLPDIFSDMEFDDGEIYGNSLLSYYKVTADGSLQVEGSTIQLVDNKNNEQIRIKTIKRPAIHDDTIIPFGHIKKFAEYFQIAKPEEVFTDLTTEEKQVFIDERNTREEAKIVEDATPVPSEEDLAAAAEKEKQLKLQAELELKASIDPKYVLDKKDYLSSQSFYRDHDFNEHIKDQFHLFYGDVTGESPCVLIKRGEAWWEEVSDLVMADKTDKQVVFHFTDNKTPKELVLDTENGTIDIKEAVIPE